MNAFTSSDHTSYPFATTNEKDFKNLLSVYLDATLRPLLKEDDFTQEGWRIGPQNPLGAGETQDANKLTKNLVFKGVVYNEMKGQMSDASYLYYIRFRDLIFPDIHNSGGDPQKMTDLTYSMLKDFHASNYHPTNAKIFTYGSMPLADHLEEVDRQLKQHERLQSDKAVISPVNLQNGPLYHTIKGPVDPLVDKQMQFKTSTSWLAGHTSDILETFSLQVLASLLLDGYGSPLYRALIESGLGTEWSPNTGYDSAGRIGIFSIGLSGVKEGSVSDVKHTVMSTIRGIRQKGFDQSKVGGILHQLELALKHKTANFGMSLMQRLQSGWFNGVDPLDALAWNDIVSGFKSKLESQGYLEELLEKYLLNDQTLTFTMEPSEVYGDDLSTEESTRLAAKIREVSQKAGGEQEAYEQLKAQEVQLLEAQERARDQNVSCLPTVTVEDVPRQLEKKPVHESFIGDVRVQWREASTNGLTYFRAINLLKNLPPELRMLLPLYTDCIMRLGTKSKSMEELEDLIKLKTGGIGASYFSSTSPNNLDSASEGLSISGYALDRNVPEVYELLKTVLFETDFHSPHAQGYLRELIQSTASGALDAIASSGHSYARGYAEAGLSTQALLGEQTSGLTQVQYISSLAQRPPSEGLGDIVEKLKAIQQFAISKSSTLRAAITCGHEAVSSNGYALSKFLSTLPPSNMLPQLTHHVEKPSIALKTFFPLPYQVSYSALGLRTVPYVHPDGAALQILAQLLTHKHLHHEIREKGGAYGGGAYASGLQGLFGMYSYRDPNPRNTVKIMQEAGQWAFQKEFSDQDIQEAKLSVFQAVDAPESVSEEGMTRFLSGVDEDMEQIRREQLLDVTNADVRAVAEEYLIKRKDQGTLAVLGDGKGCALEKEGWVTKKLQMAERAPMMLDEESLPSEAMTQG